MSNWVLIMAGGGGTRLWPASRRKRPKQFLPLLPGDQTLLGATVERLAAVAPPERTLVVTAADQVAEVLRCAPSLPRENVVVEPKARNTAACIGLGAIEVMRRDPEGALAVIPSDQHASGLDAYRTAVQKALDLAQSSPVVTVGITPTGPETGYGYLELDGNGIVQRFVEKPDRATAQKYVAAGNYLWNSGMFFFRAQPMLHTIANHLPELGRILFEILHNPSRANDLYPTAPSISIDYGVMEKLGRGEVACVRGDFGWDDIGSWAALPANVGEHVLIDASGCVLYAEGKRLIAAIGVNDLVIVTTDEATLVLPKERAQDVKAVIAALERSKRDSYL
jgi:mannose-1-phosphate guanylyltransferase